RSVYAVAGESGKGVFPLHKWETFFLDLLFRKRVIVCAFDDSIIHRFLCIFYSHYALLFVYIFVCFCCCATYLAVLYFVNAKPYLLRRDCMPIYYKFDILAALKEKGFSSYRIRKDKLLGEST